MRAQSRRKKGLARTPFKRDRKRNFIAKSERYLNRRHQVHTVVIYFYKVDTHTRHYKREIACSVVLRAPFRRTSPNLQRPFLLGFFTFPSFFPTKKTFICRGPSPSSSRALFFFFFLFNTSSTSFAQRGLRWVRGTSKASLSS